VVAQSMLAPSINIKQARSPGNFPGAASIGNRVTGTSLCMENTALGALIASSVNLMCLLHRLKPAFPELKSRIGCGSNVTLL
jgi:hypothetical protein